MVRQGSLRWLSYILRKKDDGCVKQTWSYEVEGSRKRQWQRLAWGSLTKKTFFMALCLKMPMIGSNGEG